MGSSGQASVQASQLIVKEQKLTPRNHGRYCPMVRHRPVFDGSLPLLPGPIIPSLSLCPDEPEPRLQAGNKGVVWRAGPESSAATACLCPGSGTENRMVCKKLNQIDLLGGGIFYLVFSLLIIDHADKIEHRKSTADSSFSQKLIRNLESSLLHVPMRWGYTIMYI